MNDIVSIKDMHKSFFGVVALDGMNFSIKENEIHCLIGENGCGKSTMIKIISGYYTFDSGSLNINGKNFKKLTPSDSMNEGIQVIYQDFSLFPNMTIAENIMMCETIKKNSAFVDFSQQVKEAEKVLQHIKFDIDPLLYVHQLNVAQIQMVAICRALAQDAKLIIMDEPTTALTSNEVNKLFDVVKEIKSHGVSVLFVSHKLDEIIEISDRITVMRNGKNIFVSKENERITKKEDLIFFMTGKKHYNKPISSTIKNRDLPLLEVKGYELPGYFKNINFKLFHGEILGITGLLGCGRQELAETLFGIIKAASGTLLIEGQKIKPFSNVQEAVLNKIAYVPEDRLIKGLHIDQSISDNAIVRVIGEFRGLFRLLSKNKISEGKNEALNIIHVTGMRSYNPVKSLSGGNQQKVSLIKWLAEKPRILILNCPTVGVDVGAKEEIHDIILKLASEGMGVILISDDIPEVLKLCNRILVMKNGLIDCETSSNNVDIDSLEKMLAEDNRKQGK